MLCLPSEVGDVDDATGVDVDIDVNEASGVAKSKTNTADSVSTGKTATRSYVARKSTERIHRLCIMPRSAVHR